MPVVEMAPELEPIPHPEPGPEKGGNMGMMIVDGLVVLAGGRAAYCFKIYRPKQGQDRTTLMNYDEYGGYEVKAEDKDGAEADTSPWHEVKHERGDAISFRAQGQEGRNGLTA